MSIFRTRSGFLALKKDMTRTADPVLAPAVSAAQASFSESQTNFTLPKDYVNPVATVPGTARGKKKGLAKTARRAFSLRRLFRF